MGTATDATTQVHEMRHKGPDLISVEYDAYQGYPVKWHLEGPMTIDRTVSPFAIYARRMLYFMQHWQGGRSRRSVDRSMEDVFKKDELVVKAYEGIRTTSTLSGVYQFIPSGAELLVAMNLDTYWKDDSAEGRFDKGTLLDILRRLSVPDCVQVSALSETDPNIVCDKAASLARAGGATIIVTELDYQWSSRTGATRYDLSYFLTNVAGWRYTDVIVIPQGEMHKNSPGDRLVEALNEAREVIRQHEGYNRTCSLHIWLSGSFAVETTFQSSNYTKQEMGSLNPYLTAKAIEVLSRIHSEELGCPAMMRLNLDTWEFLNLGNRVTNPYEISPEWVMQLKSRFKSIGCIVSPDKQFWQEVYASAEWSPFYRKCYSGAFKGSGAGSQPFAVMEKYLLREKMAMPCIQTCNRSARCSTMR